MNAFGAVGGAAAINGLCFAWLWECYEGLCALGTALCVMIYPESAQPVPGGN